MEARIDELRLGLTKGFIDRDSPYSGSFEPELLINEKATKQMVLTTMLEELKAAEGFMFAVAFITESGLQALKAHLFDLHNKGIKGRILTSTYNYFNQPKIFKELLKLKNVEVRITTVEGFHSKGYIFEHQSYRSLIVGSSNLTASALKVNYEWNIKLTSHEHGSIVGYFNDQFETMWQDAQALTEIWIKRYQELYLIQHDQKVAEFPASYQTNKVEDALKVIPNQMQSQALEGLRAIREKGAKRGLIVSATGTGKTYLSAFDVRRFKPKRMLFIVHREQILTKSMEDYRRVLGGAESDFGLLTGTKKDLNARYLFATIQTISKQETREQFHSAAFDYILIDESHRAGANTYQSIINYFQPEFLLGMTATPERSDGYNLFELFHYNIAYEIRLKEALEEDLLVPFHYFGVTELMAPDGHELELSINDLSLDHRAKHIVEKINYYSHAGDTRCGLMFCQSKKEAHALSGALNQQGLKTIALTGDSSQEERTMQVNRLEAGRLDYILTVDIFNEGIDIPKINQVVMLRQTDSSIIFIQQLGRGLRKHHHKAFLTVIDFIGNYENNYLIPVALYGDYRFNKDRLRKQLVEGSRSIPGESTINFEAIAETRIFNAIDQKNLSLKKDLDDDYVRLKNKLGKQPMMMDFVNYGFRDPMLYVRYGKSYYNYVKKQEKFTTEISTDAKIILEKLSEHVLDGVRPHEAVLMVLLLDKVAVSDDDFDQQLIRLGLPALTSATRASVVQNVNLRFAREKHKSQMIAIEARYGITMVVFDEEDLQYKRHQDFDRLLNEEDFARYLADQVTFCLHRYQEQQSESQLIDGFLLYQKYTRKDVFRILGFSENPVAQNVGGYLVSQDKRFCPIFVNYHKEEGISETTKYDDQFITPELLQWMSKSNRRLCSPDVDAIYHHHKHQMRLPLFVKKHNDEGASFYYLGDVEPVQTSFEETNMEKESMKMVSVVKMLLKLKQPVERSLYTYITKESH